MFKNYIFDLYGTLIDVRTDEDTPELWDKMVLLYGYKGARYTAYELQSKYKELCSAEKSRVKKAHPQRRHVDINLTNVFKGLYAHKGVEVSDEVASFTANAFRCCSTEHIRLYKGVIELLEALKKKGKKLYILSNAQHDFTVPEIQMLGIDKYFDDIIISADVECKKPDPHIFEILFDRNPMEKSESIMIGNDCVSDIRCAYEFGIETLYIHQEISPPITEEIHSTRIIMDGDFEKIMPLVLR